MGVAVFQPVINGVGGNLVAVQASRISTSFHCRTPLGILPGSVQRVCSNPWNVFFAEGKKPIKFTTIIFGNDII